MEAAEHLSVVVVARAVRPAQVHAVVWAPAAVLLVTKGVFPSVSSMAQVVLVLLAVYFVRFHFRDPADIKEGDQ
jgi:hypothetical protein